MNDIIRVSAPDILYSVPGKRVDKISSSGDHNAMELLPTPDELCGCAELEDLSDNPHFNYLLRAGFEYILNTANKISN
ncbi:hypothetical protein FBUS_08338 [Fasciolopsis buskii]|uniref:Uncharacterized protein n=1 Tax=Fasciolopsis buskii TaxID=27845 RepID=A0A8E0RYU5_9TREM|nr:hypothetical protein FBUS_08338 [Fasciolopsis buski]